MVFRLSPPAKSVVPANRLRRKAYFFVTSKAFERIMGAVILANVAEMAVLYYGMTDEAEMVRQPACT